MVDGRLNLGMWDGVRGDSDTVLRPGVVYGACI